MQSRSVTLEFEEAFKLEPLEVEAQVTQGGGHWVTAETVERILSHSSASDAWDEPNRWWAKDGRTIVTVDTDNYTVQAWIPKDFHDGEFSAPLYCLTNRDGRELTSLGIKSITTTTKREVSR